MNKYQCIYNKYNNSHSIYKKKFTKNKHCLITILLKKKKEKKLLNNKNKKHNNNL